jgi:hypothetical protein
MADCVHPTGYPDKFNNNQIAGCGRSCPLLLYGVCCEDVATNSACNTREWVREIATSLDHRYTRTAYLFNDGDWCFLHCLRAVEQSTGLETPLECVRSVRSLTGEASSVPYSIPISLYYNTHLIYL